MQKEKLKEISKIVGSAGWSAIKGISKYAKNIAEANIITSTGGTYRNRNYHLQKASESSSDFKEAIDKLIALKE